MNDILTELSKPVWWISVVVAGILINLLAAYMKGFLDRVYGGASTRWRGRSQKREEAWQASVHRLRSDEQARQSAANSEVRARLQSIHLLLLSMFIVLLPTFMSSSGRSLPRLAISLILGFAASIFFSSFLAFRRGAEVAVLLREVNEKATHPFEPSD